MGIDYDKDARSTREVIYEEIYGPEWRRIRDTVFILRSEMERAVKDERYEEAATFRDKINILEEPHYRFRDNV